MSKWVKRKKNTYYSVPSGFSGAHTLSSTPWLPIRELKVSLIPFGNSRGGDYTMRVLTDPITIPLWFTKKSSVDKGC